MYDHTLHRGGNFCHHFCHHCLLSSEEKLKCHIKDFFKTNSK